MNNNYIISIPKNLKEIQSKLFFGLTKRQLIGFSIGLTLGITVFLMVRKVSLDMGMYALFFITAPILFATIYQKDGMYIEQWIKLMIEQKYLNPNVRRYKVSKKNSKLAKERGLLSESTVKGQRQKQRDTKNEPISSVAAAGKQKSKDKK